MQHVWPAGALALALTACFGASGPEDDLAQARARWAAAVPGGYVIEQRVSCFCLPDVTRPVRLEVGEDGTLVAATYADSGTVVPADYHTTFRTVEQLFASIEEAIHTNAADLRVTYDPDIGLPLDVYIDRDFGIADEEIGWTTALVSGGSLD